MLFATEIEDPERYHEDISEVLIRYGNLLSVKADSNLAVPSPALAGTYCTQIREHFSSLKT